MKNTNELLKTEEVVHMHAHLRSTTVYNAVKSSRLLPEVIHSCRFTFLP
jgi:hypothetical protein